MGMMGPQLQAILQRMGAGGASGPQGTVPGPGTAQMASELRGSDPTFILKSLQLGKRQLSQLFVMASQSLPNVAGNIAKTMVQLDRAIKEAQQAAATQSVVRGPIDFSPVSMSGPAANAGPQGAP